MKRFYKNTLMSGAFSKALRVLALLCVLLGVSGSVWAATTIYFDNTATKWSNVYVCLDAEWVDYYVGSDNVGSVKTQGKTSYQMTKVTGNIYKYDFGSNVSASRVVFIKDNQGNYNNLYNTEASYRADMNLGANNMFTVSKSSPKSSNGTTYYNEGTWSTYNAGGGSGGDSGDDSGNCNSIEIYCHYDGSDNHDMNLHMWNNGGGDYTTWPGAVAQGHVEVNSKWYAKWIYETTNNDICVLFTDKDNSYGQTANQCGLQSGNKYYFSIPSGDWKGKSANLDKTEVINCSGSGDDDDDDDVADCDGNNIEIWCRGEGAYTDMWCYGWNPDNDSQKPFGNFAGCISTDKRMYDGHQWAVWTAEDYDKLSVIFSTGSDQCKTQDMTGLTKGNRYFFVLSSNWKDSKPTMSAIPCGGSGEIVIVNGTVYLDISKLQGWDDAGAVLKVKITDKSDNTEELALTQCPSDANIFYVDDILNLENIKTVNMLRYNDKGTSIWNQTGDITFNTNTPCVQLTGWNGDYAHYSLTTYNGACGIQSNSPVLLTKDAVVSDDGESVTMYAYLSKTFCENILEYGFVYCQGSATQGCTPTRSSAKLKVSNGQLYRGQSFELTTDVLANGSTYGYKAYVIVGEMMYISDETGYFRLADCTTRPEAGGDPINITVNAALGEDFIDDCSLTYGSLKTAVEKLRDSYKNDEDYRYVTYNSTNQSYNLQQPVTIKVHYYDDNPDDNQSAYLYRGTTNVGKYAGNNKPKNANLFENFNRVDADPEHTLTIKAGTKVAKPWIHHIVLRNSKNIVLDSLYIYSDPDGVGDNALEMDINVASGSDGWHALNNQTGPGIVNNYLDNANILITNCVIESDGFTGMHITSYNGVTFKNNDFESKFEDGSDNDINYGASAKFIYCKNIKFIQNNFRGDHATLMWIQEVNNMLVMNNVFWNTNKYLQKSGTHVPAAMRIVTQWNSTQNIGFYYNTFYFAKNDITSTSQYNFLHFSHTVSGGSGSYHLEDMYFKYNNCYSYDPDCPGSEAIDLGEDADNFCPNNFWSEYDDLQSKSTSAFAFGCSRNTFTNVKEQVCATTATGPSSLIVRGDDMNVGSAPTTEELLGFTLTTDEARADRYYTNVRPEGSGWTYGAYQSKAEAPTDVIYWVGLTDDWDDRNNWEYETRKDPNDPESPLIRQTVSCVNTFSEDLKVVIEEKGTIEITGGRKWPKVPASFTDERSNYGSREHVSAGLDENNLGSQFAKSIELEYGAGIKGVENLTDSETNYYNTAKVGFTAPRSQWILVGTVVKPLENGVYRNVKSGDYFIANHLPHVYMHQAVIDGTNAKWDETFASLEIEVEPTTVFAINIPDQYGKFKLPARIYNPKYSANYDPTEPISYDKFSGKFVNDAALPKYTGLTAGQPVLLNNSYPANIDAKQLETETGGTVQYYNYTAGTFMNTSATSEVVWLRPQHGFIFTPATGKTDLQITSTMIVDGNTRTRSAEVTLPTFSLNLFNANAGVAFSNVVLRYDELQDVTVPAATDVEKVFSPNFDAPELYIIANDAKYSRINVGSTTQVIPLGIRLKQDMNVRFEKAYFEGFNNVILTDTYTGAQYDLLRRSYTTEVLIAGDIEGRFYLNLEVRDNIVEEPDDNLTTDVEDATADVSSISIYVDDATDNTIRVVSNGTELETIYVSDMAGRTMRYDASGYAAALRLPVAQGVYMVHVVGENATRTEKVVLK